MAAQLDSARIKTHVDSVWDDSIVPTLEEYIRIPNRSPHFDPKWKENGHMDRAVALAASWCRGRKIPGMKVEVLEEPGRTPVLFIEIPGDGSDTALLYGHLDKQPEMIGWSEGLGPWTPVRRGDRLYGRGSADDGYATFASLTAVEALAAQGAKHARIVILIEACEESGSFDLPHYIERLAPRIGSPTLVVCLDSGCASYDRMWCTTSLRGIVVGNLTVEVIREGVHSGGGSGIIPCGFRVLRTLLGRLEDDITGNIRLSALHVEVPADRMSQARDVARILGVRIYDHFPFHSGVRPVMTDPAEALLNNTWRPTLTITGAAGLPLPADAGNVLLPAITVKLSIRLPPSLAVEGAIRTIRETLTSDVPYGARVTLDHLEGADGWNAPPFAPWLKSAIDGASRQSFGNDAMFIGEGGSIPFMGMLGKRFPKAQFLITGVLGPESNAHGPNEFLDIPTGKRLTAAVAEVLAAHHARG